VQQGIAKGKGSCTKKTPERVLIIYLIELALQGMTTWLSGPDFIGIQKNAMERKHLKGGEKILRKRIIFLARIEINAYLTSKFSF